jgi:hypothetical protein
MATDIEKNPARCATGVFIDETDPNYRHFYAGVVGADTGDKDFSLRDQDPVKPGVVLVSCAVWSWISATMFLEGDPDGSDKARLAEEIGAKCAGLCEGCDSFEPRPTQEQIIAISAGF